MKKLLLAFIGLFLLSFSAPTWATNVLDGQSIPPTMNLTAIRYIYCKAGDEAYTGSGYLIGDRILATAFHVAEGGWKKMPDVDPICYDVASHTRIRAYKLDPDHDFALMTGPGLPTNMPYIKYNCSRPIPGQKYIAYGITNYNEETAIFRNNTLLATDQFSTASNQDTWVEGIPSPGMRIYSNSDAPGMSGGPVANIDGIVVATTDAGDPYSVQDYDLADTVLCKP